MDGVTSILYISHFLLPKNYDIEIMIIKRKYLTLRVQLLQIITLTTIKDLQEITKANKRRFGKSELHIR